jgi:hypothetical protein
MRQTFAEHVTLVEHGTDICGTCAIYTSYLHRINSTQKAVHQQRHLEIDAALVHDMLLIQNHLTLHNHHGTI